MYFGALRVSKSIKNYVQMASKYVQNRVQKHNQKLTPEGLRRVWGRLWEIILENIFAAGPCGSQIMSKIVDLPIVSILFLLFFVAKSNRKFPSNLPFGGGSS